MSISNNVTSGDHLIDGAGRCIDAGSRIQLFCFPYAGGSARVFWDWRNKLPGYVEVCAIELPGRGARLMDPLCTRISTLVDDAIPQILAKRNKPFVLFGHSLGALIAFEIARRLKKGSGIEPLGLIVSGHRAPHLSRTRVPMHVLPESQFLQRLRAYNGTPDEVLQDAGIMEIMLPILRADFTAAETYSFQMQTTLSCPLTAYGGWQDADVGIDELCAWKDHTSGQFILRVFKGDHFFLQKDEEFIPELCLGLDKLMEGIDS
jgi:medium-chain acyl-[acyl-carrier-protein] hydrolase